MSTLHEFSFSFLCHGHTRFCFFQPKKENYYTFESAWRHKSDDIYTKTFVSLLCQSTYFCAILDIRKNKENDFKCVKIVTYEWLWEHFPRRKYRESKFQSSSEDEKYLNLGLKIVELYILLNIFYIQISFS